MVNKNMFKDFFKNLKNYLSYIMKVGFGELFIQFITLVIIVLIACFIYIPVSLVQDLVLTFLSTFGIVLGDFGYSLLTLIFKIVSAIIATLTFIYLFNKRYEDIKKEMDKKDEESLTKDVKDDIKDEEIKENNQENIPQDVDLPKEK